MWSPTQKKLDDFLQNLLQRDTQLVVWGIVIGAIMTTCYDVVKTLFKTPVDNNAIESSGFAMVVSVAVGLVAFYFLKSKLRNT